jgi:Glycosyl hydrolase catalytic core
VASLFRALSVLFRTLRPLPPTPLPMRRTLLPIAALIAALAVPASAGAYTLGVSDQQAQTFTNPLFAPLKFKAARYITPYDVMDSPADKAQWDAWYTAATAAHQKILISFEHSHRSNSRAKKAPSVAAFSSELKKFKKTYPNVKEISPWNEVNRCQRVIAGSVQGQPSKICSLTSGPKLTAQYYEAARKVFKGSKYTIVGLDILDEQNVNKTVKYLQSFLRHASPDPKVIGFHNYSDTNRFSTTRTKRVLAAFRGKVWLTETGGIVKLGTSFPASISRASKALGCMFTLAKTNSRIQRLYVYQFNPAPDLATATFDAGLINPDGTTRPGYDVVKSRKARACHK